MDSLLLEKLNQYCDQLLGNSSGTHGQNIKKKDKAKKIKPNENASADHNRASKIPTNEEQNKIADTPENKKQKVTGTSNLHTKEEHTGKKKLKKKKRKANDENDNVAKPVNKKCAVGNDSASGIKVTEDGFKVVQLSSIPKDDSDVSDAFESDIDEEDGCFATSLHKKVTQMKETPKKSNLKGKQTEKKLEMTISDQGRDNVSVVEGVKVTDDGFKVVSSIPEDDSEVSDAFDSDLDEEEWESSVIQRNKTVSSQKGVKVTDDGFKVVTEIPADDSDVSDAFSDGEETGFVSAKDVQTKKKALEQQKTLKKPLIQIMDDFGLEDTILLGNTEKETVTPKTKVNLNKTPKQLTLAARERQEGEEVVVFDYTQHRGGKKKEKPVKPKEEDIKTDTKKDDPAKDEPGQKEFKKIRYDVYKYGMSGLHAKEYQDAREALAIKLGAKPAKNKAINYKKLIEMRKGEKVKEREERIVKRQMGLQVKKPTKKKTRDMNKVRNFDVQVGREKDGMRVLSKRDIDRVNRSKSRK